MSALTPDQIDALRTRLEQHAGELRSEIRTVDEERDASPSHDPHNQVEDVGEQGEQRIREAVRNAEQERDTFELRDVAAALERIERGTYGECVDCGEDIAPARLAAQPWAARCIPCQEAFEQTHPVGVRIPPVL